MRKERICAFCATELPEEQLLECLQVGGGGGGGAATYIPNEATSETETGGTIAAPATPRGDDDGADAAEAAGAGAGAGAGGGE
eukprot:COSAG04_NODE_16678_length_492_cov_0.900763_1_plen_82_part_01